MHEQNAIIYWRVWLTCCGVTGNATSRTSSSARRLPSRMCPMCATRTLTSIADYVRDLREAGFTEITATNLSDDWAIFCGARMAAWLADL